QIRAHLALDDELYRLARRRFWSDYAAMLREIAPDRMTVTAADAAAVPRGTVQDWLRPGSFERRRPRPPSCLSPGEGGADAPLSGEGWWWREVPGKFAYRWSGPGPTASLYCEPLVPGHDYGLTIELMGAADWPTWEGAALEVNGTLVPCVL